jgi:hypothetical protein
MGIDYDLSAPGAIVVEWNVQQSSQGAAGMWDSHIRFVQCMFLNAILKNVLTFRLGGGS